MPPRLVKLSLADGGALVFLRARSINTVLPTTSGGSMLLVRGGARVEVRESPAEVASLIEAADPPQSVRATRTVYTP